MKNDIKPEIDQEIDQRIIENLMSVFDKSIVLVFLGPPASGKGTQAEKIKKIVEKKSDNNTVMITTGDLCKKFLKSETIPQKVIDVLRQRMNDEGKLFPNHVKVHLWVDELYTEMEDPDKDNIIFDGSPRDLEEAEELVRALSFWGRKCIVVKFNVSDNELIRRIRAKDRGRDDDKGDVPLRRIVEYNSKLPNLLKFFELKKIPVVEVNAEGDIDKVFKKNSWQLKFATYKLR